MNFTAADQKFFLNPFMLGFIALILALSFRQLLLRPVKKMRPLPPASDIGIPLGEKIQLSSALGPYYKWIVPCGWGLGLVAIGIGYFSGFFSRQIFPPAVLFIFAVGLLILLLQGIFMMRIGWQLKKVEFDGKYLYVSDTSQTISIPLNSIAEISEYHWLKQERAVKIVFKIPTEVGESTIFLLKKKALYGVREDLLDQLRSLASVPMTSPIPGTKISNT